MVEIPLPVLLPEVHLQGRHVVHQGAQGAARHGVAHGHVDVPDLFRDGIQHRDQQTLVGQHDGGLDAAGAQSVQDGGQLLGLPYAGRDAQHTDLRIAQPLRVGFEGLREFGRILRQELGGFVVRVADPTRAVVPAELGQPRVAQAPHQAPLAFAEGVLPDEDEFPDIGVMLPHQVRRRGVLQALRHGPVGHAVVGHPLFAQPRPEIPVQRQEDVPDAPEGLLVLPARTEMGEECTEGLLLLRGEVAEIVLQGAQVRDVGEELLRVRQELVRVAEIGQQHVAPEDELVELLRLGAALLVERPVAVIELQQQVHGVGLAHPAELREEVLHRNQLRHAHHPALPGDAGAQVLAEEDQRTPVREDETQVFDVPCGKVVPGHLFQERSHLSTPWSG